MKDFNLGLYLPIQTFLFHQKLNPFLNFQFYFEHFVVIPLTVQELCFINPLLIDFLILGS